MLRIQPGREARGGYDPMEYRPSKLLELSPDFNSNKAKTIVTRCLDLSANPALLLFSRQQRLYNVVEVFVLLAYLDPS